MSSVPVVVSALHTVARESESVYLRSRELSTAPPSARSVAHTMATCELSHSCNLLASRIAALQRAVVVFDRDIAGHEMGSLAELGLRAQTLGILLLLDELYEVMRIDPSPYQDLFSGQIHTIADVISFFFEALPRINHLWLRHRSEPRALPYRSAIRRAQCAMLTLAADPDLSHFLRAGACRTDAPSVNSACRELAAVLKVALTRELDPSLFLAAALFTPEQLYDLDDASDRHMTALIEKVVS